MIIKVLDSYLASHYLRASFDSNSSGLSVKKNLLKIFYGRFKNFRTYFVATINSLLHVFINCVNTLTYVFYLYFINF